LRVAVAESVTGGLLAARLAETPGSGPVFAGGVVAYQVEVKRSLLGVATDRVISASCAEAMAQGVARLMGADVSVAVTGVAGPERQEGQPVGLVFGACSLMGRVTGRQWQFEPDDPHAIRLGTVDAALRLLDEQLRSLGDRRSPEQRSPA